MDRRGTLAARRTGHFPAAARSARVKRTILVAESGTSEDRANRRDDVGKSSGETYAATLEQLMPGCQIDIFRPSDDTSTSVSVADVVRYDAVFITGSQSMSTTTPLQFSGRSGSCRPSSNQASPRSGLARDCRLRLQRLAARFAKCQRGARPAYREASSARRRGKDMHCSRGDLRCGMLPRFTAMK